MKLIVGLGNPGEKYMHTRHNAGFLAVTKYAADNNLGEWAMKDKFKSMIIESGEGDEKLILAMPQTFMNLSGEAVRAIKQFYKLDTADITIIHDDVDIPFGQFKLKDGGGTAGHNGLESILQYIDDGFKRIRIGVRTPLFDLVDTSDFVLANFSKEEYEKLPEIFDQALSHLKFDVSQ